MDFETDIQFVDCATGEILGHSVPFSPPSRATIVHRVYGQWTTDRPPYRGDVHALMQHAGMMQRERELAAARIAKFGFGLYRW